MKKRTVGVILGAAVLSTGVATGVAFAGGGDDSGNQHEDTSVTGPDADHATAAALAQTGGVKANSVERDTENGATWEVEVANPDGSTSDVRLDANYQVVVVEPDSEPGTNGQNENG